MKKSVILTLIICLLGGGAYWLYQKNQRLKYSSGMTADRDFALPSLDGITNIVVQHPKLQPMQYQRKGNNSWIIDNKYPASDEAMMHLTNVLTKMKLHHTPSKNMTPGIVADIKNSGLTVKVFAGSNTPVKTFHIAGDTRDNDATYMLMEGATQPYAMHLPGLKGGIRSRFEQPINKMRDNFIYKENLANIQSLSVRYPKQDDASFVITAVADQWKVTPQLENVAKPKNPLNDQLVKNYIRPFAELGTEGLVPKVVDKEKLITSTPFCIIEVKRKDGTVMKADYFVYDAEGAIDHPHRGPQDLGKIERFFVHVDNKDLYTCQTGVFGKIMGSYLQFFR
jgi:hypothetical protein